jgi:WD40 repeat protein
VIDISISSDGQYIAVGTSGGKVYLFNNRNSTPIWSFSIEDYVRSLEISSDGQYIAVGTNGGNVYLIHRSYKPPDYSWVWIIIISSISIGLIAVVIYLLYNRVHRRRVND